MALFVGNRQIADIRVQGVTLRQVVGGYELVFGFYFNIGTCAGDQTVRRASIIGARVAVTSDGAGPKTLGFARPEAPFDVVCKPVPSTMTPTLHLPLQPAQLAALETLRGAGDLAFELQATGTGSDESGNHHVQDQWRIPVSRSDWIKKLRDAGARNTLLLEIPLPLEGVSESWQAMADALGRAEAQLREGDYPACIGSCRIAMEELGGRKHGAGNWAGKALRPLASDRENMTREQREAALWAALRHYTHQAHHGPGEGGVSAYTRAEAQFVLSLTAAAAAHAQAG